MGGFVIGFIKGWLLTLVMISCIPFMVIAGGVMAVMIGKASTRGQNAYARASVIVEQTIGGIRTVSLNPLVCSWFQICMFCCPFD